MISTRDAPTEPAAADVLSVHGAPLSLQKLGKSFGDFKAVDDLSLDIGAGEFVTLLGQSGSGKTTTLLMIAGFQKPTEGSIVFDGQPITDLPAHRRNMGMVFQSYALFPHKTVFENIAFPLRRRRLSRAETAAQVNKALELVKLSGTAARYPRELSGGQQQRIAVARATVYRPRLLLMDEPLSALDKNLRQELQTEVRRIHRDLGTTVVYVTHDQEEALALSDKIVLMRDGQVEQEGTPGEVYRRPRTAFAAGFLGEANMLAGQVVETRGDGGTVVELGNGVRVAGVAGESKLADREDVVVVVRPEDVDLVDDTRPGAVGIAVTETTFLGDRVRCVGTFATGERSILRLDPRAAGELVGRAGASVSWRDDAATVIPAGIT